MSVCLSAWQVVGGSLPAPASPPASEEEELPAAAGLPHALSSSAPPMLGLGGEQEGSLVLLSIREQDLPGACLMEVSGTMVHREGAD